MSTTRSLVSTASGKGLSLPILTRNDDTVAFHRLCDNCKRFFGSWVAVDAVQLSSALPGHTCEPSVLSTVAHLIQASNACHSCALLLRALELFPNRNVRSQSDANVYVSAVDGGDCVALKVTLGGKTPPREDERKYGAAFCLRRFTYSAYSDAFQQHITTKRTHTLARENLHIAGGWIRACRSDHSHCRNFQRNTVSPHEMPTRILEVSEDKIRLRCDIATKSYEYLVLSHMWGQNHGQQLLLKEANIEEFKRDIPMQKLGTSATFREAIRVTRTLGYRYIWIDSLCIIQDSKSDWDYEATRMATVYGNAVCNIACLFPPNNDQQPTTREDPRVWHPCILRPATSSQPGVYFEHVNRAWILSDKRYGRDWLLQNKWPLFQRAWTFQEYLLSPRTLLLGHKNLMYQCSQFFHDELLGPIGSIPNPYPTTSVTPETPSLDTDLCKSKYFPPSLSNLSKLSSSDPCAPLLLSFLRNWLSLINEYRARNLSFGKDRIIAIAGIARAFAHLGNLTYLAGLWKECLPVTLLWYVDKKPSALARAHNNIAPGPPFEVVVEVRESVDKPDEIPTWSFFSTPIYAFHHLALLFGDDEVSAKRKSLLGEARVCFDNVFGARVRALSENQAPGEVYSDFAGQRLDLATKMLPASVALSTDVLAQMRRIRQESTCLADREFDCSPIFRYHPDDISKGDSEPPKNAVLALVADVQIVRLGGKYMIQRCLMGVVLSPERERGTWRRIGVWKLQVRISGIEVTSVNMKVVAKRWRGYSVLSKRWTDEVVRLV